MPFSDDYKWATAGNIQYIYSPLFLSMGMIAAFPLRFGGVSKEHCASLNFTSSTGDSPENVLENTRRFLALFGYQPEDAVRSHQEHKKHIHLVGPADRGAGILRPIEFCDGLASFVDTPPLLCSSADCPNILLYAPATASHAAAECVLHAGWRGTALGIAAEGIRLFADRGIPASDIFAFLPPAIGSCCFQTHAEVPAALRDGLGSLVDPYIQPGEPDEMGPRFAISLQDINAALLVSSGLPVSHISIARICSSCHAEFFSHRRDGARRGLGVSLLAAVQDE